MVYSDTHKGLHRLDREILDLLRSRPDECFWTSKIMRELDSSHAYTWECLRFLEESGYVEFCKDESGEHSRRITLVSLTDEGKEGDVDGD